MDSSKVGVLKEGDEVCLGGFLQCHHSRRLEAQVRLWHVELAHKQSCAAAKTNLEVLGNFTDESLEGEFANEQFRRFLVPTDLTKGHCTGAETMGLLYTTGGLFQDAVSSMH